MVTAKALPPHIWPGRTRRWWPLVAAAAIACASCVGQVAMIGGDGGGHGSGNPGVGGGGVPIGGVGGGGGQVAVIGTGGMDFGNCQQTADPGITPLTKLSTVQYRNTVRDLLVASGLASLADEIAPALAGLPDDTMEATFRGLDARISSDHIQSYFNVATAVGNAVESSASRLTAVAGSCAATSPLSAACVTTFLGGFGKRAFRRPLTSDELTAMSALNDGKRGPAEAIRAMIVVFLMSPRFVNQLEIEGTPVSGRSDYFALSPYEIASRLSYTFWQTMPDDALLAAAADGSIATDAGFAKQLDRVFADARTQATIWQFWNEWLHLESFTGFSSERPAFMALAAGENLGAPGHDHYGDMVQEVRDLTELYTWKQPGTLHDLLTSNQSVTRSADLAHLYGVSAWSGSGGYPTFPQSAPRAGLLQRAALLVSSLEQTNPFHRGSFVRRSILCDTLARPDPNALPPGSLDPPPIKTTLTTRQRYAAKVDGNGLCQGCHSQFSDLGYVLESYDALGRYRTSEKVFDEQTGALLATLPIDTNAVARVQLDDTRPVAGPAELNQRIADSGKVEACLSGNYFRYALRRQPTANSQDACLQQGLAADLTRPDVGIAQVFKRLAQHATFRQRKMGAP